MRKHSNIRTADTPATVAVVGRGLMGTACARHLAEGGHEVILIGPDEPDEPARHDGPFGSFHDAGRITRAIAHDPVWSRLSARSIARYADLESRSGVSFYTPCGGMMAGPTQGSGATFTRDFLQTAAALGLPHEALSGQPLAQRIPALHFPDGTKAALDPAGGVINPRQMRLSHERIAMESGARIYRTHATRRSGTMLTLADGATLKADHVVLATGGYAGVTPLMDRKPQMKVYQRTILFAEITEAEARRLADMPSVIFFPVELAYDLYVLPPIRYPDGRHYIKIGGELKSPLARTASDLAAWFQGVGSAEVGAFLLHHLRRVMPDLRITATCTGACAVSFTTTGYPYIERLDDEITLLTGGNGAGAKCADELGRLGAAAANGQRLSDEGLGTDFAAIFE